MTAEQKIDFGRYHGPTNPMAHYRSIGIFDSLLRENNFGKERVSGIESFDYLLTGQLEGAIRRGQKSFTILDIGSGDAGIFADFVSNPYAAVLSKKTIEEHPNLKVKMVGLTDAPAPGQLLHEANIGNRWLDWAFPVEAKNYFYTISGRQTLDNFLDTTHTGPIDLALATWSLPYLTPRVFERTIDDTVRNLNHGGKMVGLFYAEIPPGFQPENSVTVLYRFLMPRAPKNGLEQELKRPGSIFMDQSVSLESGVATVKKLIGLFDSWNAMTKEDLEAWPEIIDSIYTGSGTEDEKRRRLSSFTYGIFDKAIKSLYYIRAKTDRARRTAILQELKIKYAGQANVDFNEKVFRISKT